MKDSSGSVVRHRHARRSRKRAGTTFLIALLFAATAAISWQFARQQPVSGLSPTSAEVNPVGLNDTDPAEPASQAYSSFDLPRTSRPAYPYSVITGGIANAEDLRQAMESDPVVAQQFAGFDFQRAHLVPVSETQLMHVAYRMGDKVYWTRKKVALHPGETLISDGKMVARTRCGNRVAMVPLGPHALVDPVEADFDQPIFANDMVTREIEPQPESYVAALPPGANAAPPPVANTVLPTHTVLPAKAKALLPLFLVPFFVPSGSSSSAPLAVAPEPGIWLLLSTGAAGVYWKIRKSRRKR